MIIVIAGQKRSGSTAQYNMVRLVLGAAYGDVYLWGSQMPNKKGVHLVKRHGFDKKLFDSAKYVFTTTRPQNEVEQSMKAILGHVENIDYHSLIQWREKSVNQEYNDILNNPLKCIEEIIQTLNVEVDANEILKKFNDIKPPKHGQDIITLLYHNHRR